MKELDISFKCVVDFAKDAICVTKAHPVDGSGPTVVYVNQAYTALTGYDTDEVLGKNPKILQKAGTSLDMKRAIRQALEDKQSLDLTIKSHKKEGNEYWIELSIFPLRDSAGEVTHFIWTERDVSKQKQMEQSLEELARTDPLTGLINRKVFDEHLGREWSRTRRYQSAFSLLIFEIDNFNLMLEQQGPRAGDQIIQQVCGACQQHSRTQDPLARFSADQFGVLLPETSLQGAEAIAERLRKGVESLAIVTSGEPFTVTISLGIAVGSASDEQASKAVKRAAAALLRAQSAGVNSWIIQDDYV